MNWTWSIRSRDGGMNGLEFTKAPTAGGHRRVLLHAAPSARQAEVVADDGATVARGRAERQGDYAPITELVLGDGPDDGVRRAELWPDGTHVGLPVLLCGGEVGVLTAWTNADDRSWWR